MAVGKSKKARVPDVTDQAPALSGSLSQLVRPLAKSAEHKAAIQDVTAAIRSAEEFDVSLLDIEQTDRESLRLRNPDLRIRARPGACETIGSYHYDCVHRDASNVDLAVEIPRSAILQKDFLNYRYLDKRALFVAALATHLRSELHEKYVVAISAFRCDPDKPIITVHCGADQMVIKVIPIIAADTFPLPKLLPDRNCVRGASGATPWYNSCVLEDAKILENARYMQTTLSSFIPLRDAALLLRVWLHQRGLERHGDGWNGFLGTMLLCHLYQQGRITSATDSYHAFRIALGVLASERSFFLQLGQDSSSLSDVMATNARSQFESCFPFTLVDASGALNLASRLSQSALQHLQDEAKKTLLLFSALQPSFAMESAFLITVSAGLSFDEFISIPVPIMELESLGGPWEGRSYADRVLHVLTKAMGTRIAFVRLLRLDVRDSMVIGLRLVESNASRLVDAGPQTESTAEAAAFREFWGPKSELRRFKDGTICESVVWEGFASRRDEVVGEIARYILARHVQIEPSSIFVGSTTCILPALYCAGQRVDENGARAAKALDSLGKQLRGLDGLPLQVASLQGVHPVFSYTEPLPPLPNPLAGGTEKCRPGESICPRALDVVLQFESSARWPDDLEAIQNMKTAFYLQIHHALHNELEIASTPTGDFLDVFFAGFVFRLRIFHDRQLFLAKLKDKVLAGQLEKELVQLPRHRASIHALGSRFPSYPLATRFAKRWIRAHMFHPAVSDEAVELIAASCWTLVSALPLPASPLAGFLRFLSVLARHPWKTEPLIVDTEGTMPLDRFLAIQRGFYSTTPTAKPIMFIATAQNPNADLCAAMNSSLTPNVLHRLVVYAERSLASVEKLLFTSFDVEAWMALFRTPVTPFDLVVKLLPAALPFASERVANSGKIVRGPFLLEARQKQSLEEGVELTHESLLPGFDPTCELAKELVNLLPPSSSVFYDPHGGSFIAASWPQPTLPGHVTSGCTRVHGLPGSNVLDVVQLTSRIFEVGKGLVEDVIFPR